MGFTWERPGRNLDSEQLAHRKDTRSPWPILSASPSFLSKVKHNVFRSPSKSSATSSQLSQHQQTILSPFPFLLLPQEIREKIYGDVIGGNEKLHILRKHRPSRNPSAIGYRRCRAGSDWSCESGKCRELRFSNREYYGWFDGSIGFLLACRQM
jgi:hypothetical protein